MVSAGDNKVEVHAAVRSADCTPRQRLHYNITTPSFRFPSYVFLLLLPQGVRLYIPASIIFQAGMSIGAISNVEKTIIQTAADTEAHAASISSKRTPDSDNILIVNRLLPSPAAAPSSSAFPLL